MITELDFETYSPAGFVWNANTESYDPPRGASKKGLPVVGVAKYVEHPQAEVLSLAYDLKDGYGARLWTPQQKGLPHDLFEYIKSGKLIEAWNVAFENWVWNKICVPKYGFPQWNILQLRCAAAKARAYALPGSLDPAGEVLNIIHKKDKRGKMLLNRFSIPRNPTRNNPAHRIYPHQDDLSRQLYEYNVRDIQAEAEISAQVPDLLPQELEFWQHDLSINYRGVAIDVELINLSMQIIEAAYDKYNTELFHLTNGEICSPSEVSKIIKWLMQNGVATEKLDEESVEICIQALDNLTVPLPRQNEVKRVLEIRRDNSSAAVKKLYSMSNQVTKEGRLHDLFIYHSARTGRAAGSGPQPQNLPNSGPDVNQCNNPVCQRHFGLQHVSCPWCGAVVGKEVTEWNAKAVDDAIEIIRSGDLGYVEYFYGNAIDVISGCLRGFFIAAAGHDLICSDYSAIEAVVLAALAGESWRLEVFRTHGKIYEMSASKITGKPFDEYTLYRSTSGKHHPDRKIGKVAELASGYQGWIGAWKAFGAEEFFKNDDAMKEAILNWRAASPKIVEFWGGQQDRFGGTHYYGLEGMAVLALLNPYTPYSHNAITYVYYNDRDVLFCILPSGRSIVYHRPRLRHSERRVGTYSISFEGWNSNPKYGAMGWVRMDTYGGKLTENVVQAVSRDILAHAIVNLQKAGYPVVLHVHDEIVAEVPEGFGSVENFEAWMSYLPSWAAGWPIKASDGWRRKRYGK